MRQNIEMAAASATYVVELTPAGRAAVAVVLVSGPEAVRAVDECFAAANGRRVAVSPVGRIKLGHWGGEAGEELIVCRRTADSIEIHCHGGVAAVKEVVQELSHRGCVPMSWQEWLRRTNDDSIRAAAQVALANAPTVRTAAILLDQYHGAMAATIHNVFDAARNGNWSSACDALDVVLSHRALGLHLTSPWQVVIAGPPNVGKSSLMNALVGYQRAIVCDLPGTTRDVVAADTAIDGWPVQFSDTAGLRDTRDQLESAGIERANAALATADLIILVDDAANNKSRTASSVACFPHDTLVIRVLNKIDLLATSNTSLATRYDALINALNGEGIPSLIAAIGRALVPHPPAPGASVPFTAEQIGRLEAGRAAAVRKDAAAITASLLPLLASK
jgi:tRNA modification GTPase